MIRPDALSLPNNRSDADLLGYNYYYTGIPCKNGHLSIRSTKSARCLDCNNERVKRLYCEDETHRQKVKDYQKSLRDTFPEINKKSLERFKTKYHSDFEYRNRLLETAKKRLREDAAYREMRRLSRKKWNESNRHKNAAVNAVRRSVSRLSKPRWLTEDQKNDIRAAYLEARRLTELTGDEYEVDHIIPLRGKSVCGLHVPWNLRVITKRENRSKFNKVDSCWSTEG